MFSSRFLQVSSSSKSIQQWIQKIFDWFDVHHQQCHPTWRMNHCDRLRILPSNEQSQRHLTNSHIFFSSFYYMSFCSAQATNQVTLLGNKPLVMGQNPNQIIIANHNYPPYNNTRHNAHTTILHIPPSEQRALITSHNNCEPTTSI